MRVIKLQTTRRLSGIILASALLVPVALLSGCDSKPDSADTASFLTRADTYADQGQYRSAMLEVRNAIQADPDNVSHIVALAEIYQTIGAHEQASELLEPWLDTHASDVALPLARSYVERGKHLSAMETLENHSPKPGDEQLEASLIRAEALRLSGEPADALALFDSVLADKPASKEAITGIARSYLDLNKPTRTIERVDEWNSNHLPEAEPLYWKGMAQYGQNRLEMAAETLTEAAGAVPGADVFLPIRGRILAGLSRVLTEQGRISEAQVYNQILAENSNSDMREQSEAAVAAIQAGKIEEAKTMLRDLLKLNPGNDQVAMMLGALAAGTGELEEGTRLLTENLDPETTPTQLIRAATMAQIDTGDREEALEALERAVQARPNDNDLLAMYGILALSLPEHQETGVVSLNKAISKEPERVRLRLALAQHYYRNEQPEQALGQLRMAFTANPTAWNTTGTYLNLLIQQGETTEAEEIRDSLLNGYGDDPSAVLLASMADAQLDNNEMAQKRLESLVEENPELQAPKLALATTYAKIGENDKAVNTFIKAALITPDAILPLQRAGQIYARDHSTEEVQKWLDKVGQENPALRMNANALAALIHIGEGELAAASTLLDNWKDFEAVAVRRATGQLLQAEARAGANSENYKLARKKAAEAIALEPDNLELALFPVAIYQKEGKLDDAISALDAVEESFGTERLIVLTRAALLGQKEGNKPAYDFLLGQWQTSQDTGLMPSLISLAKTEARGTLNELTREWLEATPDSVAAHMARADWLMANNQQIVAANHYEQAISRQPNNVAALNNLAWLLRNEDQKRALELAEKAQSLAPGNAAVLDTYGWVLHLSGKHTEAKAAINEALALAPDNAEIREHLEAVEEAM